MTRTAPRFYASVEEMQALAPDAGIGWLGLQRVLLHGALDGIPIVLVKRAPRANGCTGRDRIYTLLLQERTTKNSNGQALVRSETVAAVGSKFGGQSVTISQNHIR
jgi:hypothetical protein